MREDPGQLDFAHDPAAEPDGYALNTVLRLAGPGREEPQLQLSACESTTHYSAAPSRR